MKIDCAYINPLSSPHKFIIRFLPNGVSCQYKKTGPLEESNGPVRS